LAAKKFEEIDCRDKEKTNVGNKDLVLVKIGSRKKNLTSYSSGFGPQGPSPLSSDVSQTPSAPEKRRR
jgi:hypothetical protein